VNAVAHIILGGVDGGSFNNAPLDRENRRIGEM